MKFRTIPHTTKQTIYTTVNLVVAGFFRMCGGQKKWRTIRMAITGLVNKRKGFASKADLKSNFSKYKHM